MGIVDLFDVVVWYWIYEELFGVKYSTFKTGSSHKIEKSKPIKVDEDPDLYFKIREKFKNLKFAVLVTVYLMNEDDNRLDFGEKLFLKKFSKELKAYITEQEQKELILLTKSSPSLHYLVQYAEELGLDLKDCQKVFYNIKLGIESNKRYMPILELVERTFLIEKDTLTN